MTVDSSLWQMIRAIRHAEMKQSDREILRPVFASFDVGEVRAVPEIVVRRIRDIHARMPKHQG